MRIGFFEYEGHLIYLYTLCKIFDDGKNELFFYVSDNGKADGINSEMKRMLGCTYNKFNWVVKNDEELLINFFRKSKSDIRNNNLDILFLNTALGQYFHYFYLMNGLECKIILTMHDINRWFLSWPKCSLKSIYQFVFRKMFVRSYVDAINVFGENLKAYIELEQNNFKKPIFTLPFSLYEPKIVMEGKKNNHLVKFVIPGVVDTDKRDYDLILDIFEELFAKFKNICLIILGYSNGSLKSEQVISRCKLIKSMKHNIIFFDQYIPQQEFEEIMGKGDLLIAATKKDFYLRKIKEVYGESKESGATYAMIRYALPGFVPLEIKIPEELRSSVLLYNDKEDLKSKIEEILINRGYFEKLKSNAVHNARRFTAENIRNNFYQAYKSAYNIS